MTAASWSWERLRGTWIVAIVVTFAIARFVFTIPERNSEDLGTALLGGDGDWASAFAQIDFRWQVQQSVGNLLLFVLIPVPLLWITSTWLTANLGSRMTLPVFHALKSSAHNELVCCPTSDGDLDRRHIRFGPRLRRVCRSDTARARLALAPPGESARAR